MIPVATPHFWPLWTAFFATGLPGQKIQENTCLQHICQVWKLSKPVLLILTKLLNTEIAQNLELQDWILAKCDQYAVKVRRHKP